MRKTRTLGPEVHVSRSTVLLVVAVSAALAPVEISRAADSLLSNPEQVTWALDAVQATEAWDGDGDMSIAPGEPDGTGVTLCIIDSGLYNAHDDLAGISATGESQIPGEAWDEDGIGQGTAIVGIANAPLNGFGVVGVAPGGLTLYVVKVFDNTGTWTASSDLGAAASACASAGADIVLVSVSKAYSASEEAVFASLYDDGILVIAPAGDGGTSNPAYPASYPSVISVGGLLDLDTITATSQFPATVYDSENQPAGELWDAVELAAAASFVTTTVPAPDGDVPIFSTTVDSVVYGCNHLDESGLGTVHATLVDGGLCDVGDISPTWSGAIVLCERGAISFAAKVNNVGDNEGVGALIYNNTTGNFWGTCGGACVSTIPALTMAQADGQYLRDNKLLMGSELVADDGSGCVGCTGGYAQIDGSVLAAAAVAGAAGWLWSACDNGTSITNVELRQLLRDSALDLIGTRPGGGTYGAGYDEYTGFGRAQLKAAYDLAQQRFPFACGSPAAIFMDGFESGNTSAWGSVTP